MQIDSEVNSPGLVVTNQYKDTFSHLTLDESIDMRLLSFRCYEAQKDQLPCQDYALLAFDKDACSLVFCVCDGVGESYRGNFAASFLAQRMISWLRGLPDLTMCKELSKELEESLQLWAKRGQNELQLAEMPVDVPIFLRNMLREHRDMHGSETVFFAGRIDFGHMLFSQNQKICRAIFCWMGNVSAHLFLALNKSLMLGDVEGVMNDRNRWSTRSGRRGKLSLLTLAFDAIERLIIHTDGLDTMSSELANLDDVALQTRSRELLHLPKNDDMTVLDIRWKI